jgi:hypothetical protein
MIEISEYRVILQQVCKALRVRKIVNSDEIDIGVTDRSAKDIASNASKAVDTNFHRHYKLPSCCLFRLSLESLRSDQTHYPPPPAKLGSKLAGSKEAQDYAALL